MGTKHKNPRKLMSEKFSPGDIRRKLLERVDSMIMPEPNTGCWLWMGASDRDGRPSVSCKGMGTRRTARPYRLVMERALGRGLAEEEVVCHRCDIPSCCNVDHLFVGTQADNMRDASRKKRCAGQVISAELARQLIARVEAGEQITPIARDLGVSYQTVWKIVKRKTHVSIFC